MDKDTRREVILDNYSNPFNRGLTQDDTYKYANTRSSSCIDNIEMMMKIEDGKVVDVVFDGEACAICTSATSILLKKIIGKSVEDAKNIIDNFKKMINEEEYDKDLMGELLAYEDLYLQPSRKNCALIPSKTVEKLLNEEDNGN